MSGALPWTEQINIPYEDFPPWCLEAAEQPNDPTVTGNAPSRMTEPVGLLDRLIGTDRAVISLEETAKVLDISESAARRAEAKGQIPSIRMNRKILVPTLALRRLLGDLDVGAPGHDDSAVPNEIR